MLEKLKNTDGKVNKMGQKKDEIQCYAPRLSGFISPLLTFLLIRRWKAIEFGFKGSYKILLAFEAYPV